MKIKTYTQQLELLLYYTKAQSQLKTLEAVVDRSKVDQSSRSSQSDKAQAVILSSSLKALLELQKIKRSELEQKRSKKDQK